MGRFLQSFAAIAALAALVPSGVRAAGGPAFEVTTNSYQFGQAPDWMPDGEHVVHDGVRAQLPPDPARDAAEFLAMLEDPPLPDGVNAVGLTPAFLVIRRTEIGRYVP